MRISFILHGSPHFLPGASRVFYEYASRLIESGHDVKIVHAPYLIRGGFSLRQKLKNAVHYTLRSLNLFGGLRPPENMFRCPPALKIMWIPSLHRLWLPSGDAIFCTHWEVAEWVAHAPARCGQKYYVIQELETCYEGVNATRVLETWKAPMHRIVISKWLLNIAKDMGLEADYIPNGLNFSDFALEVSPSQRNPKQVLIIHNTQTRKGFQTGLKAILKVKDRYNDLAVTCFGWLERPADLPSWMVYHPCPPRSKIKELYNHAAIFLSPSFQEGWGLAPCEAAQCGAALALTDIGGHREFAIPEVTALMSPPSDGDAMARNIIRLIENPDLRFKLAEKAHEYIQQFTWQRSVEALERILMRDVASG